METKEIYPICENVKSMGRNLLKDNVLYMMQSGAYVEFNYICHCLYIDISACLGEKSRIAVLINDNPVYDLMINVSEENRIIEIVDSERLHYGNVKIIKLNEAQRSSVIKINKIITDIDAKVYPAENKNVRIEFIGDSITCGYGVDCHEPAEPFENEYENAMKAFPYLTAQQVKADYQVVAYSGYGIVSGFGAVGEKIPEKAIPQCYEETALLPDGSSAGKWDFDKFIPDIIVINLGTNDFNYCNEYSKYDEVYEEYIKFLRKIRSLNPNAELLCTIGVMGDKLTEIIQNAVWNYSYDFNDEKIHFAQFETMKECDGYGANYHPSFNTHKKTAKELTRVLRKYYDEMYKLS